MRTISSSVRLGLGLWCGVFAFAPQSDNCEDPDVLAAAASKTVSQQFVCHISSAALVLLGSMEDGDAEVWAPIRYMALGVDKVSRRCTQNSSCSRPHKRESL